MSEENDNKVPEFVVTFADFLAILRKHRQRIKFCTLTLAIIAGLYALSSPIRYEAKAVFHQKGKSSSGLNNDMFQSLFSISQPESEGIIAMKSLKLNRELVKTHGLQATILPESYDFPLFPVATMIDNIRLEMALWTRSPFPVLREKEPFVTARDVVYEKLTPMGMALYVESPTTYVVKWGDGIRYNGVFGQPLVTDDFSVVLEYHGKGSEGVGRYSFELQPMEKIAEHVQKSFALASDLTDKNLINIAYRHPSSKLAVKHVNSMMALYQDHVIDEHKRLATAQLEYLLGRQRDMGAQLREMMESHAKALSEDLSTTGFSTSERAMEFLATNQQNLSQKLLTIELEIQRLESISRDTISNFDKFLSVGTSDWINHMIAEMRSLKQQADSLSLALRSSSLALDNYKESFESQLAELDQIKEETEEAKDILSSLKKGELKQPSTKFADNQRYIVKAWYDRLVASRDPLESEKETSSKWQYSKEGFSSYLSHLIDYLQVHQRNIEERLSHQQTFHSEFQGISPNTAKELYIAYCRELSEKESQTMKIKYVIGQLSDPNFELSSLSTILNDATSAEMINKAANTSLALKDTENRSTKEQDRLKSDLALQKTFLASHLKHTIDLLELNQRLLKEKIYSLQSISLSLLQSEMSVLEQQMKEYITSTIEAHKREKTLLERNLNGLRIEMATLPQKWAAEQLIEQQMAINRNMIEEISRLVETKNITSNLEKVQSVPLDLPAQPVHPRSPRVVFYTLLGTFLGMFVGALWALGSSMIHGVGASLHNMRALGMHISGYLSSRSSSTTISGILDDDLETLRRLAAYMRESSADQTSGKSLLLLEGKGPNYAPAFADLLMKGGAKVVVVDLNFDKASVSNGLLQYLEGQSKELAITHGDGYDKVCSGGIYRFAIELLASERFKEAGWNLVEKYDWVLYSSNATLNSSEAETLLDIFPRSALTLNGETLQQLSRVLYNLAKRKTHATFLEPL